MLLAHYAAVLPHEFVHSFAAWVTGIKADPWDIHWGVDRAIVLVLVTVIFFGYFATPGLLEDDSAVTTLFIARTTLLLIPVVILVNWRRIVLGAKQSGQPWTGGRMVMSPISTSCGCSMAKAIALATASAGRPNSSMPLLI